MRLICKEITQVIKKIANVSNFKEDINMVSYSVGFIKKMDFLLMF